MKLSSSFWRRMICFPIDMKYSGPNTEAHEIARSLQMVGKASAYMIMVSHKYGQTPGAGTAENPDGLSITELEFNEAQRLKLPTLLFVMGDRHPVVAADTERDPVKLAKLNAFRDRAKLWGDGSDIKRIYAEFNSIGDLVQRAGPAVTRLRLGPLAEQPAAAPVPAAVSQLPLPPALRALPKYIGSHAFIRRDGPLAVLNTWCQADDSRPLLLFEAIGGAGKSMLAWEWLNCDAVTARRDWAGRFWYSFYERGPICPAFAARP